MYRYLFRSAAGLIVLAVLAVAAPGADAGKWKTVGQQDTGILLQNWPDELPCTYRAGGYNARFSQKRSGVFCPIIPYHQGDRTYIRVSELQPGYYWDGGYDRDIREHPVFNQAKGYFSDFKAARFPGGQDFDCYGDSRCQFRNIRFAVDDKPCQWVYFNPDIGNMDHFYGPDSTPFSVSVIHCGAAKAFTRRHFRQEGKRITVTFPGREPTGTAPSGLAGANAKICRLALNADLTAWQEQGFADYVDVARRKGLTVADCRRALEQASQSETHAQKPAAQPGAKGDGFANCFDNPAACK